MAQYIDKSILVAEIERRKKELIELSNDFTNRWACASLDNILYFLDTLKVKEVDLEKEIETHLKECLDIKFPTTDVKMIAKDVEYTARMFFELGLLAQKGE